MPASYGAGAPRCVAYEERNTSHGNSIGRDGCGATDNRCVAVRPKRTARHAKQERAHPNSRIRGQPVALAGWPQVLIHRVPYPVLVSLIHDAMGN